MRRICLALALGATLFGCGARSSLPRPDEERAGAGGDESRNRRPGQGGSADEGGGGQGTGGEPPFVEQCDDSALFVYVLTDQNDLFRFDPATVAFSRIGAIQCPTTAGPFSMAVSRSGRAYSVFNTTGEVFRINVEDASCRVTDWEPLTGEFKNFGMGYAIDDDGLGESLYVADIDRDTQPGPSAGLARLDTTDFSLDRIGAFSSNPGTAIELTSSDDGELYGYFINSVGGGGTLVRIDKSSAEILEETPLPPPIDSGSALAFAYWNGDFYIFTTNGPLTDVTRYRPSTGEVGVITQLDQLVVGAGVTTCDPDDAEGI